MPRKGRTVQCLKEVDASSVQDWTWKPCPFLRRPYFVLDSVRSRSSQIGEYRVFQNHAERGIVNSQSLPIFDVTELFELIHKVVDAASGGTNQSSERPLTDPRYNRYWLAYFVVAGNQQ
jgi:hypothetical protein